MKIGIGIDEIADQLRAKLKTKPNHWYIVQIVAMVFAENLIDPPTLDSLCRDALDNHDPGFFLHRKVQKILGDRYDEFKNAAVERYHELKNAKKQTTYSRSAESPAEPLGKTLTPALEPRNKPGDLFGLDLRNELQRYLPGADNAATLDGILSWAYGRDDLTPLKDCLDEIQSGPAPEPAKRLRMFLTKVRAGLSSPTTQANHQTQARTHADSRAGPPG